MANCLFCKILAEEIPAARVLENTDFIAFLDIAPAKPGHILIVPKKHYENLLDFPPEMGTALLQTIQQVGAAQMKALGAEGFNVLQNNFPAAGQEVFHVHWHVVPRFTKDGLMHWPQGAYASLEEMQAVQQKIRNATSH